MLDLLTYFTSDSLNAGIQALECHWPRRAVKIKSKRRANPPIGVYVEEFTFQVKGPKYFLRDIKVWWL